MSALQESHQSVGHYVRDAHAQKYLRSSFDFDTFHIPRTAIGIGHRRLPRKHHRHDVLGGWPAIQLIIGSK
eukprot:scaffold5366_cov138-Skeletonema_menzelii.AAC.2